MDNTTKSKNYVVGILSMFENDLKLFKVTAENEYEAVKAGMMQFADTPEAQKAELEWQESAAYPKDLEGLHSAYEDMPFAVIEVAGL
jgi:hypothetical protein